VLSLLNKMKAKKKEFSEAVTLAKSFMSQSMQEMYTSSTRSNNICTEGYDFHDKDILYDVNPNDNSTTEVHVRLEMYYNGLHVIGGDSVVHLNFTDLSLLSISKTIKNPITADTCDFYYDQISMQNQSSKSKELVFYSGATNTILAWDIPERGIAADGTPFIYHYIVDATTGDQVQVLSDVKTLRPTGKPRRTLNNEIEGRHTPNEDSNTETEFRCSNSEKSLGIGNTMYSMEVEISTSFSQGYYSLKDTLHNCHYTVVSLNPYSTEKNENNIDDETYDELLKKEVNIWGNGSFNDIHTAAADAHFGHAAFFDFFKSVHGRQGVFDDDTIVYSRVHVGKKFDNVYWLQKHVTYGDGDGIVSLPLVSLEFAAHEFSHGIDEATANLEYAGESGGLGEATADIFAVLVDFYTINRGAYSPNYLIGESTYCTPGMFDRSLILPSSNIVFSNSKTDALGNPMGGYDCYCKNIGKVDVHASSGVGDHFFYLLAEGTKDGRPSKTCNPGDCQIATGSKTLTGIGREKAGKIWYRALTHYFTSHTNYAGARKATIKAAKDLYGEKDNGVVKAVENAWTSVNVNGKNPK